MSIYYPSFMPSPQVDYSFSNQTGTIKQQMESGYISQRARQTKQRDVIKAQFKFNFFQLGIWEGFVDNTLNKGAAQFYLKIPDPANQDIRDRLVLIDGGLYDAPAIAGENVWQVTCVLILQEKVTIGADVIELLEIFDGDSDAMIAFSDLLHTAVHEALPSI